MAGASEAATRCLAWLQAVKAAPEGEKHNVAVAVALKLVYQDSVTLQGGEIYRPTGWTTRAIAARLAEQGYQCGHTTVHDWKTKHADSAEWIRSSPLDQVLQLVKESPSCGGQSIFTEDELEYCIRLLEGFARAGQCLNQKQAGAYLVKLSRLPRMSGAPRRQFAGSLPSHEWWNAFLRDARGRLAIRKGRTLELTRIAALQAETLDCLPGLLKQLFDEHPLLVEEPGRISNMDETEITTRFFAGRVICTPSLAKRLHEKRNMAENVRLRPMRRAREQAPDHDDDAPGRISQRARLDSPDQAVQAPPALVDLSHWPNHLGFVPAMFPSQHLFIQ
ncbi:hypothetical protein CAOG_008722 [Capsaspora owczarzaki ATCC 30864]|uniref:Uncharacterized protein n=1 Tax=Capsaspora owczarzaki (strain ATCC 30864) TaxID=595528 RepID=A0A0D2WPM5_CAPO3|nr:hypothetical protein CAOG_008722 [Capsaspora owczarzaki ATCC 30864]